MRIAAEGNVVWRSAAFRTSVVDPSGSGDAFTAGIITGMLHGWEMPRTLRYAGALGASATLAVGCTGCVFTSSEAQAFLEAHSVDTTSEDFE